MSDRIRELIRITMGETVQAVALLEAISTEVEKIRNEEHDEGHDEGYSEEYDVGHAEVKKEGKKEGYDEGFSAGLTTARQHINSCYGIDRIVIYRLNDLLRG